MPKAIDQRHPSIATILARTISLPHCPTAPGPRSPVWDRPLAGTAIAVPAKGRSHTGDRGPGAVGQWGSEMVRARIVAMLGWR